MNSKLIGLKILVQNIKYKDFKKIGNEKKKYCVSSSNNLICHSRQINADREHAYLV